MPCNSSSSSDDPGSGGAASAHVVGGGAAGSSSSSSSSCSSSSSGVQQQLQPCRTPNQPIRQHAGPGTTPAGHVWSADKYERIEPIGSGTYGVVYKCRDKVTEEVVAMKHMRWGKDDLNEGMPQTVIREVGVLKSLSNHPNIVQLREVVWDARHFYFVFEHLDQDLKEFMNAQFPRGLPAATVRDYAHQILSGMSHCHACRVLHRDLKPQNILVAAGGQLKLADFGLARTIGLPTRVFTHEVVTLWYRSPEVMLGTPHYTDRVDTWSIGCIFAELVTNKALFPGACEIDQLFRIFRARGTPTLETWPDVDKLPDWKHATFPAWPAQRYSGAKLPGLCGDGLDLLEQLTCLEPARRINAEEALNHAYFKDVPRRTAAPAAPATAPAAIAMGPMGTAGPTARGARPALSTLAPSDLCHLRRSPLPTEGAIGTSAAPTGLRTGAAVGPVHGSRAVFAVRAATKSGGSQSSVTARAVAAGGSSSSSSSTDPTAAAAGEHVDNAEGQQQRSPVLEPPPQLRPRPRSAPLFVHEPPLEECSGGGSATTADSGAGNCSSGSGSHGHAGGNGGNAAGRLGEGGRQVPAVSISGRHPSLPVQIGTRQENPGNF